MNQQINLYLPEFRKEKEWLNANGLVEVLVLVVILLIGLSGLQYWQQNTVKNDLSLKRQERLEQINQTNALIDSFGVQEEDAELLEEVRELEDNLRGKQILLDFLMGRSVGNTAGFSEYLADLSRYHVSGLRLTGLNLQSGGASVVISGEVFEAENVPLYLQSLSQGESFVGTSFEMLRMEEKGNEGNSSGLLMFDVATLGRE